MINSIQHLIDIALSEDIGIGDITTDNLISADLLGFGEIKAKESFIVTGVDIAKKVFRTLSPSIFIETHYKDGARVKVNDIILSVDGNLRALLNGERTALNFMQRLSGIATNTNMYVKEIEHTNVRLMDTRKITPGWRILEKYAVRVGGAHNHRIALYDGVLIKDNHITVCGGIKKAVEMIRNKVSHLVKIEVEVSGQKELKEALSVGVDVIMLDNMDLEEIKKSVKFINKKALVEVSGNVRIDNIKGLADTGVDIISSGALTHQATSVDISMRIKKRE